MPELTAAEVKVIKSAQLISPVNGYLLAGAVGKGR